ncbi:PDZ domain-containing protein [Fulvivirgaceae bacterium PWU5]|uniref:PDZ domain-containing protein n=1 Tax=Dawidia cretensis TaxID=2782350 RepID=A0AAP2GUP2_9BACT|nr:S41 family peptidase [Dawidia cretensis]MBT1707787.1 PDZ domain-containing protein [Dawidia cretensis]
MQTFKFLRPGALLACCALLLLAVACKDDDDSNASANNRHVNDWILTNMQDWYLWNDELPTNTNKNLAPDEYFSSLLYDGDRFSWIQDNYLELLNSLQGISKEAGYEYALYRESNTNNNVIAQILYIKPSSPAKNAGLKRGDVITHINNTQITISNYQTLLSALSENHTLTYRAMDVENESLSDPATVSLTPQEYHENPNYLHAVIETGEHKIGYYVYNFFASGQSDGNEYDTEMESIINGFKTAGITDLVLDLRFNSGGSEVSALNLASLLGADVNNTKVFMTKEYNDDIEQQILNEPGLGEDILTVNFTDKAANVGNLLQNKRLFILTGSRTASASELIINGLRPYMDVFLVGDTTYGKNVGSTSLYDDTDATNTWGMQPIVVKVYNSLNQSDYDGGFYPNIVDPDNDFILYPFGDAREPLLAKAIGQITGSGTIGRTGLVDRPLVAHSLDRKKRSFQLTVDDRAVRALNRP